MLGPVQTWAQYGSTRPQFEGVVVVAGPLRAELVIRPDRMTLHLSEQGKPLMLMGASARLSVVHTRGKSEHELRPDEGALAVRGAFDPAGVASVQCMLILPNRPPQSLSFLYR